MDRLSDFLSYMGSLVLFLMMLLTAADVAFRYVFNHPILGALEITEFMVATLVFCFLGVTEKENAHVSVDLLVKLFPPLLRKCVDLLVRLVSISLLLLLIYMSTVRGMEMFEMGEYTSILHIPVAPFLFVVALGFAAMCLEMGKGLLPLFTKGKDVPHG